MPSRDGFIELVDRFNCSRTGSLVVRSEYLEFVIAR
jgi:hypothetical protein